MMKYIREYNSYSDIDVICKEYDIENYIINNDGSIDVNGDVDLSYKNLKNLPLNFNKVTGDFLCYNNQLTSLEGCPKEVTGFYCSNNKLISLEGCPTEVAGDFSCSNNNLTLLDGCPDRVIGHFYCAYNRLNSLKGCPTEVGYDFNCSNNKLISLEGCPKEVGGSFYCSNNQLTSLEGCAKEVGSNFSCHSNKLPKLIMDNYEYIKGIAKWQDEYSIWRKDGSLDVFRFNDMMIDIKNDYDLKYN